LPIDTEELRKTSGILCHHCTEGAGCTIYETRPQVCRGWYCGWRRLKYLPDNWKPSECGVLVDFLSEQNVQEDDIPPSYDKACIVQLLLLNVGAITGANFAEVVGGFVEARIPTFLAKHGPVGFANAKVFLNEAIKGAVAERDRIAIIKVLHDAVAILSRHVFEPLPKAGS
jgi:hypothetical protein